MMEYQNLLEDEVFKHGEREGSSRTAMTVLTDVLLELNALEIYYQKPSEKSIAPPQIRSIRERINYAKELLAKAKGRA